MVQAHGNPSWLLLLHHIPPTPPYLRAKVTRRLSHLGALVLKRSAYLLPASDTALEDLQWLRQEIRDQGGDAWILECRFAAGRTDAEIRESFRATRTNDYRALEAEARLLLERVGDGATQDPDLESDRRRLARRVDAVRQIDFFSADGRESLETLMSTIERLTTTPQRGGHVPEGERLQARIWATRAGVKVDRMGSAWLIRRFIDPAATFAFVAAEDVPPADALRFDMFDGEFTHEGDRCTFEALLNVSGRTGDAALGAIAQIVHDLDLRDDRYQRPETAGVGALIAGIVSRFEDDNRRLVESAPIFETLYASLGGDAAHAA